MIAAVLALALQVFDPADQDLSRYGPLPCEVRAFVERRASCNHFAGEFNGDRSERDREVTRAMRGLRCNSLEADEARLRRRHAKSPTVQNALTETRDWQ
jgi:hypothetical protein